MDRRIKIMIGIIVILILALASVTSVLYVKPKVENYLDLKYRQEVILLMLQSLDNQGYIQIGIGNQSIILVPYIPE